MLPHDELIEQAYFFRVLGERMHDNTPMQELLSSVREEILATTRLPLAIDFMLGELRHVGVMGTAMEKLPHYFTAFQTYVVQEAENERGRFDFRLALDILREEAEYRAKDAGRAGAFMFQFETLCRNRLKYDAGLAAIAADPLYDDAWRAWILLLRHQIGMFDLADLVYVRSEYMLTRERQRGVEPEAPPETILFGDREGKIALANRRKDPLLLFAALQRHLGYPAVPRQQAIDESRNLIPQLLRRVERLETRIKLFEEEQKGGIDITKLYARPDSPPPGVGE